MRLYLLLNTGLKDASRLNRPPQKGDVICYFRRGQDPGNDQENALRIAGATLVSADTLFTDDENRDLDAVGTRFLRDWFRPNGTDFTTLGDISLGIAYSMELARQTNPRVVIRFGEVLRRLLEKYPQTRAVVTDICDGNGIFEVEAAYLPLNKILGAVARKYGADLVNLPSIDPVPPALKRVRHSNWIKTGKSLLGGFRPVWLTARFQCRYQGTGTGDRPSIYMILGRGQEAVATRLAQSGQLRVIVNRQGIQNTYAYRGEQLFALPRIADIATALSMLKRLKRLAVREAVNSQFSIGGIDYAPVLFGAVRAVIASQIWSFLVVVAQSRRLHRVLDYQALFVAGAGAEFMGNLLALDQTSGRKVYLMPHGMDLQRFAYLMPGSDRKHVDYLSYGADHEDFYTSDGGPRHPLRVVQTGNPLTTDMLALRRSSRQEHQKRLLILSFGHLEFWNADRIYVVDRYYTDLFAIARALIAEGWQIGLRAHPSHPSDLERRIATHFGIADKIQWDTGATFEDALARYDVAVCSASTTFYQSLYAGWPTIFYEPAYRRDRSASLANDPMMTGLVTAKDLSRPVTSDPGELEGLIRSSVEKDSLFSTFPAFPMVAPELAPKIH